MSTSQSTEESFGPALVLERWKRSSRGSFFLDSPNNGMKCDVVWCIDKRGPSV